MNTMNKQAIEAVQDYISFLDLRLTHTRKGLIEEISYSKTTAYEILDLLRKHPTKPPRDIVNAYKWKLNKHSVQNLDVAYVFAISVNTADRILSSFDIYLKGE